MEKKLFHLEMEVFQGDSVDFAIKVLSLTYSSPTQNTKVHKLMQIFTSSSNLLLTSLVAFELIQTGFSHHVTKFVEICEWFVLLIQVRGIVY